MRLFRVLTIVLALSLVNSSGVVYATHNCPSNYAQLQVLFPGLQYRNSPENIGLPVGIAPKTPPALVFSNKDLVATVAEELQPGTLIVTDQRHSELLSGTGATVMVVNDGSAAGIWRAIQDPRIQSAKKIVAVGSGAVLDIAKASSIGHELVVLPTILSINSPSVNRAVVGMGVESFSYTTNSPSKVVLSLPYMMRQPAPLLAKFSQSGWGDLLAGVSAYMDGELRNAKAHSRPINAKNVEKSEPELFDAMNYLLSGFTNYDATSTMKLAKYLHTQGVKTIEAGTNVHRIGGEHQLYKVLMDVNPTLRKGGPTHGQIVAYGTLITAAIFAKESGDKSLFVMLRQTFRKLGIATTWTELQASGLSREDLEKALRKVSDIDDKGTTIGNFFKKLTPDMVDERGNIRILDEVFNDDVA